MQNQSLFQIITVKYVNGEEKIMQISGHNKDSRECRKIMKTMFRNDGYILRKYPDNVEFYADIDSHWTIKLILKDSTVSLENQKDFFYTREDLEEMRKKRNNDICN